MKKSIIPVAAFIAGMAIVPSVFADTDKVGGKTLDEKWASLNACLEAKEEEAAEKVVCTLGKDITTSNLGTPAKVSNDKEVVLDLNGHNITLTSVTGGALFETGKGNFSIIGNGTISSDAAVVNVAGAGDFTMGANVVAKGSEAVIITTTSEDANVLIEGTVENNVDAKAAFVMGKSTKATATVTGSIKNDKAWGVFQGAGTLILDGAHVDAATGIDIFGGKIAMENAVINAKGAYNKTPKSEQDQSGAALQVYSTTAKKNVESINIEGSTLSSVNGHAIVVYGNTNNDEEDLGDFILKNVNLNAKNADTFVMVKSGDDNTPSFANYLVDGKGYTSLKLTDIKGNYTSPAEQGTDEPTTDAEGDKTENPNTADTIATYLTIATVALLGLGATAFVAKKSNR